MCFSFKSLNRTEKPLHFFQNTVRLPFLSICFANALVYNDLRVSDSQSVGFTAGLPGVWALHNSHWWRGISWCFTLYHLYIAGFAYGTSIISEEFPGSSAGKESACNAGDPGLISRLGSSSGEGIVYPFQYSWASLMAQMVKNPPTMWETWVWSLGWEIPLEEGMATHSGIVAWRVPADRGA